MSTDARQEQESRYIGRVLVGTLVGASVLAIYFGVTGGTLGPARKHACTNNLKQFGIALQNYIDAHHAIPPAYIVDDEGRKTHSWRAVLLPYFEDEGLRGLYNAKEPWDRQHPQVIATLIPVFRCEHSDRQGMPVPNANYVAVVGPDTAWPGGEALDIDKITDGLSNTIAVVEIASPGVPWADPRDLTFEEAARGINQVEGPNGISGPHAGGVNVLFLDGRVEFLPNDTPPERLRALLTANGGEKIERSP